MVHRGTILSKCTTVWLWRLSRKARGKGRRDRSIGAKTTANAAAKSLPTVAARVHVGAHNHLIVSADLDRATTAHKGLLVDVAMSQNSAVDQRALGRDNLPPIGVLRTTEVGATDLNAEARPVDTDAQHIGESSIGCAGRRTRTRACPRLRAQLGSRAGICAVAARRFRRSPG